MLKCKKKIVCKIQYLLEGSSFLYDFLAFLVLTINSYLPLVVFTTMLTSHNR